VRDSWPAFDLRTVLRWGQLGTVFRLLAGVAWITSSLGQEWIEKAMRTLRFYQTALDRELQAADWLGSELHGGNLRMTTSVLTPEDEEALRQCLARAIPDLAGGPSVTAIRRERFNLSTSYDTYLVTVRLAGGSELRLFQKDFGFSVRPKDGPRQRRERELRVYQELLADAGLGTARYYGSVVDESRRRFWLLLEFVDGTPVGYCDLDYWPAAAEGLGRLHGAFARQVDRLRACDFLLRHDGDFFWSKTELALEGVGQIAPHLVDRLATLVNRYAPVVAVMTGQPPTLVHGGCRPCNILVRVASDPARVCILDWEEAAVGAPLFDVAYLLDGFEPPTLDRFLDAYRRGASAYGLALPPPGEMKYVVDCFHLHMTVNSLSQAVLKGYKERDVAKLLGIAERLDENIRCPSHER
jgi:aminoglycoside phosphotransferase (APT) family kinase protein